MKRIIIILVLSLFFSLSCNGTDTEKAQIRENVEKLSVQNKLSDHCDIYCTLSIRDVYRKNGFAPFWKDNRQINEFVRIVKECENEGLNPADYQLSLIETHICYHSHHIFLDFRQREGKRRILHNL